MQSTDSSVPGKVRTAQCRVQAVQYRAKYVQHSAEYKQYNTAGSKDPIGPVLLRVACGEMSLSSLGMNTVKNYSRCHSEHCYNKYKIDVIISKEL